MNNSEQALLNSNFVGRQYAFDAIAKLWNIPSDKPRSMLLWGDWSVGKSEVLWNVKTQLDGIIVAYANLQCLDRDREPKYDWQSLVMALEDTDGIVFSEDDEIFLENPYPAFVECLGQVLHRYPNSKLLLVIDEYEVFLNIEGSAKILRQLEELTLKHDNLGFLLCGSHDSDQVDIGFNPTRKFRLGAFTKEETIQYVNQQPYKFDADAIDRLYELTSGQPWLIRGLCFNIISEFNWMLEEEHEVPSSVSIYDVDEIANSDRFYENHRSYFASLYDKQISCSDTTLQQVLNVLVEEPQGMSVREIASRIGTRHSHQIWEVCKLAMEHSGSLISMQWENDVRIYRVAIELFRRWIIRTQK